MLNFDKSVLVCGHRGERVHGIENTIKDISILSLSVPVNGDMDQGWDRMRIKSVAMHYDRGA